MNTPLSNPAQAPSRKRAFVSLRKLVMGSGMRTLALVLSVLAGFFLTPFTVHRLGAANYGIWALAYAFIGYYSVLDLGLSGAIFTHMSHALGADDPREANRIYNTGLAAFAAIGAVLLLVTFVLTAVIWPSGRPYSHVLAGVILLAGIQTSLSFPMRAPFGVLNAGSHFDLTAGTTIFSLLLRSAATVLVLLSGHGVVMLALGALLAGLPGYMVVLLAVHRTYPFVRLLDRSAVDRALSKKLLKFGVPVIIGQVADRVRLQTDAIVVSMFLGMVAVAHYNIASTLVLYYIDGILAIVGVLTPLLTMQDGARDREGLRKTFFSGTQLAIGTAGFAAFSLVALGHPFIARWMGRDFLDAYPVLVVLVLASLFDLMHSTAVATFYATMHQNVYATLNSTEAVLNLLLSVLLVRRYGMIGVALGTLVPSFLLRTFVQPFLLERYVGIAVREYVRVTGRACLAALVFLIAPAALALRMAKPQYANMLLVAVGGAALFFLPYWAFVLRTAGRNLQWKGAEQGLAAGAVPAADAPTLEEEMAWNAER
ncbi:MAG: lipopolysaccharide biosynthesis protein [Acidobacteriaceae bacterium]